MLRDDIKSRCATTGRKVLELPAPELELGDDKLYVRELRGDDLVYVARSETGLDDRTRWAIRSISDEAGNRVFCDDDLEWLASDNGLPTPLIERAYFAARHISGHTEENRRSFLPKSNPTAESGSLSS